MNNNSELDKLINSIRNSTTQLGANRIDEVSVMTCMLNDKDFRVGIYDKSDGYIGSRCPANEATMFVKNIIQNATGLDSKDSLHLAESYKFTKKDATFMLSNMRDFMDTYMRTGRKFNILQNESSEASIYTKEVPAINKKVPDKDNGISKEITTSPFTKLVSLSKSPRYNN